MESQIIKEIEYDNLELEIQRMKNKGYKYISTIGQRHIPGERPDNTGISNGYGVPSRTYIKCLFEII